MAKFKWCYAPARFEQLAEAELANLPTRWKTVDIDAFMVMPNHIHAIIIMESPANAHDRLPTLRQVVGNYKPGVTRIACERGLLKSSESERLWQGRYHDHIIRNEMALQQSKPTSRTTQPNHHL